MIARPPVWVIELTTRFWTAVGEPPTFPRDLRSVLCWLQAVRVVEVPHLTLARAAEQFARYGIPCRTPTVDRPLAGCFGGHGGIGVILFDATLEFRELIFTLAHELAHYLRDYDKPRRKILGRLGPKALEVLDGLRPPTANERLAGVLRDVRVGSHLHYLDRDRWGRIVTGEANEAEEAADRLAYELLAPFDVLNSAASCDRDTLSTLLQSDFGFPAPQAAKYATILIC